MALSLNDMYYDTRHHTWLDAAAYRERVRNGTDQNIVTLTYDSGGYTTGYTPSLRMTEGTVGGRSKGTVG